MKYITTRLGTEWYAISGHELSLMFLGGLFVMIAIIWTINYIIDSERKKTTYLKTLTDKEHRNYTDYLRSR